MTVRARLHRALSRPVQRNLLLLLLPWSLLLVLLAGLLYERLLDARLAPLLRDQQNSLNEGLGVLNRHLTLLRGNLMFLAQQPLLEQVFAEPDPENLRSLSRLFLEFSASAPQYDQIRWLDERGQERVRVDFSEAGEARLAPPSALQNKAARYYFVEAMALGKGDFYLSRLDPNPQPGPREALANPTLRAATPLFAASGRARGVLVLNYRGQHLLARLDEVSRLYGRRLSLVDHQGRWMLAAERQPDSKGFMGEPGLGTLASRYPASWAQLQLQVAGQFSDAAGIWSFSRFDPYERDERGSRVSTTAAQPQRWLLVSLLSRDSLQALRFKTLWQVLSLAGVMLIVGLLVVLRLARAEQQRDQARQGLERRSQELADSNLELQSMLERLKRTQRALVQAEKLSSLGMLVAGVAHELNTPIGAASMAASALHNSGEQVRQGLREGLQRATLERFLQRNEEGLTLVLANLARMAQLTKAFKQLASDRASTERRVFDLVELVQEVLLVFTPRLKSTPHEMRLEMPEALPLDSYPGPLGQMLQNLIDNALIHAFEEGQHGWVKVRVQADPLRHACVIEVEDNGCGMCEEVLAQIFDPFFTTRRGQGGTGLGLHITHQLAVEILGADLQVRSMPGQGTCFCLRLPMA